MKLLPEHLERAINLERLAASEADSKFKTELLNQANAYRKLAARRAEQVRSAASEPARKSYRYLLEGASICRLIPLSASAG